MSTKNFEPKCSFCGKGQSATRHLIAGPENLYICESCIDICNEVIANDDKSLSRGKGIKLLTPQEIKNKLDDYIIGQEKAKKILSVAVYNHYKRVNYNMKNADKKSKKDDIELKKSNVLLLGPTGSGKTLLAQTLSKILNVPFAIADATALTEAGYVGEDVENILLKLIQNADYDIERAQHGIIYVDEIDKIARKGENVSITRDVSGEGVQQALLKIIESTVASVPPQGGRKHPQQECIPIDTTNILFIFGGAFVGLEKIIQKRKSTASLGFGGVVQSKKDVDPDLFDDLQPQDFISFGLIPEFVGRVPVSVSLTALNKEALVSILEKPKDALTKQYKKLFSMDGVNLEFRQDAIEAVAEKAIELKTGARGLRTILEQCMLEIMYSTPTDKTIDTIYITKECINDKGTPVIKRKPQAMHLDTVMLTKSKESDKTGEAV